VRWLLTSVCPSVVCPVVISEKARDTAQPAVVIDDRPVTPWLTNIYSPLTSTEQTICLGRHVDGKARLRESFLSQWRYSF